MVIFMNWLHLAFRLTLLGALEDLYRSLALIPVTHSLIRVTHSLFEDTRPLIRDTREPI